MANQNNQSEELKHTQYHGAHSGSHAGLSDYNDGSDLSHYGGNDDCYHFEQMKHANEDKNTWNEKVAFGNKEVIEEDLTYPNVEGDENNHGKRHSGL